MVYYSRYGTGKRDAMLGVSLLQLVTSKPEACWFLKAQLKQSLPCSFHVLATRHSFASVYPTLTKYISTFGYHQGTPLGFHKRFLPCPAMSWMLVLILRYPPAFLLVDCVHGISDHALKLISALKFPRHRKTSFLDLKFEQGGSRLLSWLVYQKDTIPSRQRDSFAPTILTFSSIKVSYIGSCLLDSPHP
jgi:hypothetical protein